MNSIRLTWDIREEKVGSELRYCSGCKTKVVFTDSLVRRHNANGKNIYQFAIYKCDKGHTWNKSIDKYHSDLSKNKTEFESRELNPYNKLVKDEIEHVQEISYEELKTYDEIIIEVVSNYTRLRLDKLISDRIKGISRGKIQSMIKGGCVLLNNENTKTKYQVKNNDRITIGKLV